MSNLATSNTSNVVIGHIAAVEGKTATERRLSVVKDATGIALMALVNGKDKASKFARERIHLGGIESLATAASHANYRPVAEYFAARMGESVVIRKRADFEALPARMEERVLKAESAKNGGRRVCKKTGESVPGAALALALDLHREATELVALAQAMFAKRLEDAAAREAANAE